MDYTKINPLHGIVVMKMHGTKESEGGILYIEEKRLDHATVVALGPGEWIQKSGKKPEYRGINISVGDTVVIGPGSGVILEVEIGDETDTLTFIAEQDIVAVVRK